MIEHLHDREKALGPFGLKGREAQWVALVCLHSGVFTRPQFCFFFDDAPRVRTALTLRVVFSLPLRQTEGFLDSLLRLMGLNLKAPDHTTPHSRAGTKS